MKPDQKTESKCKSCRGYGYRNYMDTSGSFNEYMCISCGGTGIVKNIKVKSFKREEK